MASDLFPERGVKLKTIGFTYSMFNMICPFFGGIPVCHGSGGMAGHYVFGGRTGGSVLIYGVMLLTFGAFFGSGFDRLVHVFPLPVLGVILATEGVVLMRFVRDIVPLRPQLLIALITAFCAVAFPYGFLIGLIAGTTLSHLPALRRGSKLGPESPRLQEVRNA
jgi:MFS superfamily sulfate permease-like transporter